MFEKIALFKDNITGLSLYLASKNNVNEIICVNFNVLDNNFNVGNLQLKHFLKENKIEISDFFIASEYRNKGFGKRLFNYGIPILEQEANFVFAKAFYAAEKIIKNNNWHTTDNRFYKSKI